MFPSTELHKTPALGGVRLSCDFPVPHHSPILYTFQAPVPWSQRQDSWGTICTCQHTTPLQARADHSRFVHQAALESREAMRRLPPTPADAHRLLIGPPHPRGSTPPLQARLLQTSLIVSLQV
jgi:hypothetical protein